MKLNEFNLHTQAIAKQALAEHYKLPFTVEKMSLSETRSMLHKVNGLISEAKATPEFYRSQTNPAYLKLMFMQQALVSRVNEYKSRVSHRIVVENEEVDKSQVVLAAQDMVDSIQKMIEQVSDMLVKELPALTDSVQAEIGVNESEQFNSQTSEALSTLTAALAQTKTALQGSLNLITGQGGAVDQFNSPEGEPELAPEMPPEGGEDVFGGEDGAVEEPEEAPEEEPVPGAGRVRR